MSWWRQISEKTQGIVEQAKQAQQQINKELQLDKTFQSFNKGKQVKRIVVQIQNPKIFKRVKIKHGQNICFEAQLEQISDHYIEQNFLKENFFDQINKATANLNKSFRENVSLEQVKGLFGEQPNTKQELPTEKEQLQFGVSEELVQYINTSQLYRVFREYQQKNIQASLEDNQSSGSNDNLANQDKENKQEGLDTSQKQEYNENQQSQADDNKQQNLDVQQKEKDDTIKVQPNQQDNLDLDISLDGDLKSNWENQKQQPSTLEAQKISSALEPWQITHARIILQRCQDLDYVRYMLCPRKMEETQFWNIYFQYAEGHINEARSQYEKYIEQVKQQQVQDLEAKKIQQQDQTLLYNKESKEQNLSAQTTDLKQSSDKQTNKTIDQISGNQEKDSNEQNGNDKEQENRDNEDYENWEQDLDDDPELREILKGVLKDQDSKNGEDQQANGEEVELNDEEMQNYLDQSEQQK